ncbi:hypothetical protein [Rhodococcus sp. SGAir0479]|uniref:hypothetical protein n=1 Tax=Rhodococcus sp. SGAir0479 TaxID=2567884 RepID=UPI00158643BD|nr:hypothetical protein [Rhodococcus sp. SGAir0479]
MSQDLVRERRRKREAEQQGRRTCKHCAAPIQQDTYGWHHAENKRVVCQLVTTAEPKDS